LMKQIPGLQFREMQNPDLCCGSAGIYNIVHYEPSMSILDEKMKAVHQAEATTIVTTNPGCLLQMRIGIERSGQTKRMRAVHLVELLAESANLTRKSTGGRERMTGEAVIGNTRA
jgi:glycolate oxidase iron-sulfur subunit